MNTLIVSCPSCGRKNRIPAGKQHLSPRCGNCRTGLDLRGQGVVVELGDGDFHDFINQASLPVMVDFFSPTCGPCQMMMPVVESLAREHLGTAIIARIDTSRNQRTAGSFNIRGVPTFMFFRDGRLVDQIAGAVERTVLEQKLNNL